MQHDDLRSRFTNEGHYVSARDDVNETAAAWFLSIKPGTLRNWRREGRAPAHLKLGSVVWYPLVALMEYLERKVAC